MNIPVISVEEKTLAEAYEKSLVRLYQEGIQIKTQYDKPGDPLSLDCTANITVLEPETDPMIHKAFPGGIDDLKEYVMELQGFKDSWVKNMNDPDDTRWEYTYHGRLANWGAWKELEDLSDPGSSHQVGVSVNQIDLVIEKLVNQPYTRQAQMITWMPNLDRMDEVSFEDRTYNFNEPFIREMYNDAGAGVIRKIENYNHTHGR